MKSFMMWLDDKNIATWDTTLGELIVPPDTNIYDYVDDYKDDAKWHGVDDGDDDDDDDVIDDDDDDVIDDDDDELGDATEWTPEEHWIDKDNDELSDEALQMLYEIDKLMQQG
tara:strand:+ start:669 stop:1007 length:339 start_codon:yes stop_codon:yes gene_type:complete